VSQGGRAFPVKEMSEEKPVFKITDRRLFNADGTARDVEREEETPTPSGVEVESRQASEASSGGARVEDAASESSHTAPFADSTSEARSSTTDAPSRSRGEERVPESSADPTHFVNLLMFIASPAAAALGMTEHPGIPATEIDLPLAKHCIDLLGTLRQKTDGNLTAQEEQIFEGLLAELRMQFVSLSSPRTSPMGGARGGGGGGFTGSDITGGR
jgi:hypothetical protein